MTRPQPSEYPPYYEAYVSQVKGDSVIRTLGDQILNMQNILSDVPEEKEDFTYAEGKWTMKEVIGHVIDTERIFAYRALRIARNDKTPMAGFDQDTYVPAGNFNSRSLYDLAHEFGVARESNIILFKSFDEAALNRTGIANEKEISTRALIYIVAGHAVHHLNVIKQRYLVEMV